MSHSTIIMVMLVSIGFVVGGMFAHKYASKDPQETRVVRIIITAIGQAVGAFVGAVACVFVVAPVLLLGFIPVLFMGAYIFRNKDKKTKTL